MKKKRKTLDTLPWLRKIRNEDSKLYYDNPKKFFQDMKKIKDPIGRKKLKKISQK